MCETKCHVELSATRSKVPHYMHAWWGPPLESVGATLESVGPPLEFHISYFMLSCLTI